MSLLFIFVLWTWGLTPLWVNIVGTVLLSLKMCIKFFDFAVSDSDEEQFNKAIKNTHIK